MGLSFHCLLPRAHVRAAVSELFKIQWVISPPLLKPSNGPGNKIQPLTTAESPACCAPDFLSYLFSPLTTALHLPWPFCPWDT